ncbi:MAG: hypothetical protein D5R98_05440 [Desulfonatronovibrio sp. MSAO_Bac4]|nr:MAG: hypothetical protein D5R98_05440 [Desulfonatronovibrio sp. MSAO_Bac4]
MKNLYLVNLPRKTWLILFAGIALIIFLAVSFIMPLSRENNVMAVELARLEAAIEEQKILYPLYAALLGKLNTKQGFDLSDKEKTKGFDKINVDNASDVLKALANSAGFREYHFAPVPESISSNFDFLLLEGSAKGEYDKLRVFLTKVSLLTNFEHLEMLEILSRVDGLSYSMRLWIFME